MSKLLKWLKQWSYKLKTMLKHKKQSMILGFAIDPDLVCRRYENRAWRGVFGVKQWSYKLETNIKQNAFLPFILKEQNFKAI